MRRVIVLTTAAILCVGIASAFSPVWTDAFRAAASTNAAEAKAVDSPGKCVCGDKCKCRCGPNCPCGPKCSCGCDGKCQGSCSDRCQAECKSKCGPPAKGDWCGRGKAQSQQRCPGAHKCRARPAASKQAA